MNMLPPLVTVSKPDSLRISAIIETDNQLIPIIQHIVGIPTTPIRSVNFGEDYSIGVPQTFNIEQGALFTNFYSEQCVHFADIA